MAMHFDATLDEWDSGPLAQTERNQVGNLTRNVPLLSNVARHVFLDQPTDEARQHQRARFDIVRRCDAAFFDSLADEPVVRIAELSRVAIESRLPLRRQRAVTDEW